MPHALFRLITPAEAELHDLRRALTRARLHLDERECALDARRTHLHNFEARYIRQVGVLYRQLDEWEERIAELKVAHESPEETARLLLEAELRKLAGPEPEEEPEPEPLTADEQAAHLALKQLFRELARLIHPDHAYDAADERRRTRLMAQANDAYRRDDPATLRRLLHGYDPLHPPTNREQLAAELTRVTQQLHQVHSDITLVEQTLAELQASEMSQLEQAVILAAQEGRDLLAEMAARVKGRLGIAMRTYDLDLSRIKRPNRGITVEEAIAIELRPRFGRKSPTR
ncbi:MAG: hypothetical protein V4555_08440 [Acidobacteriota bacterium]